MLTVVTDVSETMPQWAVIKEMKPDMFAKDAFNMIVSVLGKPLHGEYLNTIAHPHCLGA